MPTKDASTGGTLPPHRPTERRGSTGEVPPGHIMSAVLDGKGGMNDCHWGKIRPENDQSSGWWLHLDFTAEGVREWLEETIGLSEFALYALLSDDTQPRMLRDGEHLLLLARGMTGKKEGKEGELREPATLRFVLTERWIISLRLYRHQSAIDIYEELKRGEGPHSVAELLGCMLDYLTDYTHKSVAVLEDQMEDIEESFLMAEDAAIDTDCARSLGQLRRDVIGMRRYLVPQRDMLHQLAQSKQRWLLDALPKTLGDVMERTNHMLAELAELRERAALVQEEQQSQLNLKMARSTVILSVFASLFLPLGILAGALGMNVGGIPFAESDYGFWIIMGGMLVLLVVLVLFFKRMRWL